MSLTLRHYPLASGTANLTHVNEDLADIQNKFGSIDDSDIAAGANIAVTKLAAYYQEWVVQLLWTVHCTAGPALVVWPAASATTPLVAVPMPGQSGDGSWVATDVSFVCNDVGTADASFDVRYGHYDGTGVWTNDGSIKTGQTITRLGGDATGSQGRNSRTAVTIPNGSTVTSIALMSAGQGTNVLNGAAATGFLCVSVRLRRQLQSI